jgi:hypothetical protein
VVLVAVFAVGAVASASASAAGVEFTVYPNAFTSKPVGTGRLETKSKDTVECGVASGSGKITGAKALAVSTGKLAMMTEPDGELVHYGKAGGSETAIDLKPAGEGGFPEFKCKEQAIKVHARGSFLCAITPVNRKTKNFTVNCKEKAGVQEPIEFENAKGEKVKSLLETEGRENLPLWEWQQTGLSVTSEIVTEKEEEIKA